MTRFVLVFFAAVACGPSQPTPAVAPSAATSPNQAGGTTEATVPLQASPGDRDGDGLPDAADQCPDAPEDFDNYEDADGCADVDNDGDGVLDTDDACPNAPGPGTQNGCQPVAADRDGDGIVDSSDQCPDAPEDLDGFEDADGCLDNDNDGDGILDVDDTCPNKPEDRDGDRDEDGCPE